MTQSGSAWRDYRATGSEEAFRRLVEEHVNLVYAAALRITNNDRPLAQDVAQTVFADLARKAAGLSSSVILAGWLYRHTCFTATKAVRAEQRRRLREQEAAAMSIDDTPAAAGWTQVAPMLDEAIDSLAERDRNAIVLRFLEGRSLHGVGELLGISDAAAQKRVARALEKLRRYLARRGVACSAGGLAALFAAQTAVTAPAGLAGSLTTGSLAASAAAGGVVTSFWLWNLFMTTKTKLALGAVVAAGVSAPLYLQQRTINRLRAENEAFRAQVEIAQAEPRRAPEREFTPEELQRQQNERTELLRLRSEVGRLRAEQSDLARLRAENQRLRSTNPSTPPEPVPASPVYLPSENWANAGFATPLDALQTRGWAVRNADIVRFKESVIITDSARQLLHNLLTNMSPNALAEIQQRGWGAEEGLMFPMMAQNTKEGYKGYRIISQSAPTDDELRMEVETETAAGRAHKEFVKFKRLGDDWKVLVDEEVFERTINKR